MTEAQDRLTVVVNEVMALPHVVSAIVQYAQTDRLCLSRLMRTNRNIYAIAGPVLYDTVTVSEKNFEPFFRGAFDSSTDDLSRYGAPICNLVDNVNFEHFKFPQLYNKAPFRHYRAQGDDSKKRGLPLSKKELLSFVRVLTLGSHHGNSCAVYYTPFRKYVTNVEVFRIVDTPVHEGVTVPVCCGIPDDGVPQVPCPIISAINPRKVVLRNLSRLSLPFPPLWSLNSNTKEVVIVLPTVAAYLHDPTSPKGVPERLAWSFKGQFHAANLIRIVFWPEWDHDVTSYAEARRVLGYELAPPPYDVDRTRPLPVDTACTLVSMCKSTRAKLAFWRSAPGPEDHKPRVQFFGLESLKLDERRYRTENPSPHPPPNAIVREDEYLFHPMPATRGKQIFVRSCPDVTLLTVEDYERGKREAEISQWD